MLREQRLMFFEESGEDNSYKKYNKYKDQIEEIKNGFPEDKKNKQVSITNYGIADKLCKECEAFLVHSYNELKSNKTRSIQIRMKADEYNNILKGIRTFYQPKNPLVIKISDLLNSTLDKQLNQYKASIENYGKNVKGEGDFQKKLIELRKSYKNIYAKAACNSLNSLFKTLNKSNIEITELYLKDMIDELKNIKRKPNK